MSMIAGAASAWSASPLNGLFYHPNRRSLNSAIKQPGDGSLQGPASTTSLLGTLLQSSLQVAGLPAMSTAAPSAGASGAVAAAGSVRAGAAASSAGTGAAPSSSPTQQVQSFMYSLFQALKADGLGAAGASGAAGSSGATLGSSGATISSGATLGSGGVSAQYAGSLASSLQTLIQQLGSGAPAPAQVANLRAAFNNLVAAASGAAGSSAATPATSNAALQNFLSNVLQSVQGGGSLSLAVGSNVNAKV